MNRSHHRQTSRSTAASVITYVLLFAIGLSGGYVLRGIQDPPEPADVAEFHAEHPEPPFEEPSAPFEHEPTDVTPEPAPPEPEPDDGEEDAYHAGRHLIVTVRGTELDNRTRDMLREVRPGGVLLAPANIENEAQTRELALEIKETVSEEGTGVDDWPLIAVEQEGGDYNHLALPDAPAARQIGGTGEPAEAAALGGYFAEEARERGIGVLLAPVMDIPQSSAMAVLDSRAYSAQLNVVTAMGLAFGRGVMDEDLIPVVKHYPGYGAVEEDAGDGIPVIEGDHAQLAEIMFPFREAARRGTPGIMVGHIAVPALDLEHPDRPATLSPVLIRETLRERWDYEGVIVADDMTSGVITSHYDSTEACIQAFEAGNDAVILRDPDVARIRGIVQGLERAIEEGRLDRDALEESGDRLEGWRALLRGEPPEEELPDIRSIDVAEYEGEAPGLDAPLEEVDALEEPDEPEDRELQFTRLGVRVKHEVQPGEYLAGIAQHYGVSQQDIMEWNDLPSHDLQQGTTLVLYVSEEHADAADDELEPVEPPTDETPPQTEEEPAGLRAIEHMVEQGETLTRISQRYGVTAEEIIEWNDLEDETIRWGVPLTIYVPEDGESD